MEVEIENPQTLDPLDDLPRGISLIGEYEDLEEDLPSWDPFPGYSSVRHSTIWESFKLLFRGRVPNGHVANPTSSLITKRKAKNLAQVGIVVPPGRIYVNGLVNVPTLSGRDLDLLAIARLINSQLYGPDRVYHKGRLQDTLDRLEAVKGGLVARVGGADIVDLTIEQKLLEAELGNLLLPVHFYADILNPLTFHETNLVALGKYAVWVLETM